MDLLPDEHFMKEAFKEAQKALALDEVPVGAVVVYENKIIARAHNYTEHLTDVTAHAEMQAITSASSAIGAKYLIDCTIYITLEPCVMCAGALFWSQISKVVYAASDEKRGYSQQPNNLLHPKTIVVKGVMEQECSTILSDFFRSKR